MILVLTVLALAGGWALFARNEHDRFVAVDRVRQSRSEIRFSYAIEHARGPLAREEWHFANLDGRSTAGYLAVDRNGDKASFDEAIGSYDVTFLFDRLVADGIWELQSRPPRGADPDLRTVRIEQVAGATAGAHAFNFSDPRYLATSAGREYHIHLERDKPVPDVLRLDSVSAADPRYGRIVADFAAFGSPRFVATVAAARAKLGHSPAAGAARE